MEIDDILADVDQSFAAQTRGAGAGVGDAASAAADLQELTRRWVAERVAPEVLPWPDALMERVMDRVRAQVRTCVYAVGVGATGRRPVFLKSIFRFSYLSWSLLLKSPFSIVSVSSIWRDRVVSAPACTLREWTDRVDGRSPR